MKDEEKMGIKGKSCRALASLVGCNDGTGVTSIDRRIGEMGQMPEHPAMREAPGADDVAVLRHLAGDIEVAARGRDSEAVERLWDVCGLPDFEQLGAEHHSRTVLKLWQWRTSGSGTIDAEWFASRLARQIGRAHV